MSSRTAEELKNRLSQIENMTVVIADVKQKTADLETKNRELLARKGDLGKKLEIKSGRLEFILDEKENLFAKLQKVMELNQELKKKAEKQPRPAQGKGWFKGGWFSGVKNYFKKKDLETIDVSGGKVRKNIKDDGRPMNISDQLENSSSYFTSQTDKDIHELRRKRNEQMKALREQREAQAKLQQSTLRLNVVIRGLGFPGNRPGDPDHGDPQRGNRSRQRGASSAEPGTGSVDQNRVEYEDGGHEDAVSDGQNAVDGGGQRRRGRRRGQRLGGRKHAEDSGGNAPKNRANTR